MSLESELDFHVNEELLVPNNEPQVLEKPHTEDHGVEENIHADPSTENGRRPTTKADRFTFNAAENVGETILVQKQRQSLDRFNGYMALMSKFIVTKPSSFKEVVQQKIWVDTMVEEYESIVKNNACEVVPSSVGK